MSFSIRRTLSFSLLSLGLASFGLTACEDDDPKEGETGAHMTHGSHGATGTHGTTGTHGGHGTDPNSSDCMGAAAFAPNIVVTGKVPNNDAAPSTHKLTIINSEPVNPEVGTNNAWIVRLDTLAGQPVDNATFKAFTPEMPHHGHGLPAQNLVQILPETAAGPGVYRVTNLNFNMPGYWKTTAIVEGANPDGTTWMQSFVFDTCIGAQM